MRITITCVVAAILPALLFIASCTSGSGAAETTKSATTARTTPIGNFDADSAYKFIAEQVACGPRVPGTLGHDLGRDYILNTLKRIGYDSIMIQEAEVTASNGDVLPITNIIIGYNCRAARRILLAAHWDTRPWADQDPNPSRRKEPFAGANDGGSGVGVLMEIARNLSQKSPAVGVDIMFTDGEDYGNNSEGFDNNNESWCLGTQYWIEHMEPYTGNADKPVYAILLDMVGGRDAKFYYEAYSLEHGATPSRKVWSEAEQLGYGDRFIRRVGGAVTDDHVFFIKAGIPATDVIELNHPLTSSFNPTWHTHSDNLSNIDRNTLKAVGQTVLNVVYKEKPF